ncbi:TrbI/VirB10 family protein [Brevundimonas sp. LM2]|uniref:TrbI/VirB10 family protein n=1 Tax=Brevundimonas sp. LM2 TaxID=1938605 RepID=UPI00209ACFBF|nr:TrbI/VirB10 family protein [Brevundimonas sp. LM2]
MLLGGTAGLALAAALTFALTDKPDQVVGPSDAEPVSTAPSEAITRLPRTYGDLPQGVPDLGPPLPGDLGGAMVAAGTEGSAPRIGDVPPAVPAPVAASAGPSPAETARIAARTSGLFFAAAGGAPSAAPETGPSPRNGLTGEGGLSAPTSPYVLQAGTLIPAALITGVRSDLPGPVIAQVTQTVYDSPTGRHALIPQGTRLIGAYAQASSVGQSRIGLVWNRMILPGGRSIALEDQPGADAQGFVGLQDRVDRHWRRLFATATLSTVLGLGAALSEDDGNGEESEVARALRRALGETGNGVGQAAVGRQLDLAPTLTLRPGHPLVVLVTRDLVLPPQSRSEITR